MICELCSKPLDEDTMVSCGEFFICEDCDDAEKAREALKQSTVTLEQIQADVATKH